MRSTGPLGRSSMVALLIPAAELALMVVVGVMAWTGGDAGEVVGGSCFDLGMACYLVTVYPLARVGSLARELTLLVGCFGGLAVLRVDDVRAGGSPLLGVVPGVLALLSGGRVWIGNRRAGRVRSAIDLACPYADGTHTVVQGGTAPVNHHVAVEAQRFALDLVRTRPLGPPTRRLVPRRLEDYLSFGEAVSSPTDGIVIDVTDGRPDLAGPEPAMGNCVVIEPRDHPGWRVVLAHLQAGSTSVARGDAVTAAQPVGAVGTSGNSTEPHLHIHVEDEDGHGVPMRFGSRRPLHRNDTLIGR